jgi:RNA polymerase sigma factor (sigma-70 family)
MNSIAARSSRMLEQRMAVPDLSRVFSGDTISGLSEWQLLERYLERRDEIAFEALLALHGPMVLGVCRRMLAGQAEIEDAFQATFLVLVRRAPQLGPAIALGPWLHGVAARVSLRARSQAARHRRAANEPRRITELAFEEVTVDCELHEILDQELTRLPEKYRSPLVLCYLEGQTHEEAARKLCWPLGTVKGRLARARELLRLRLTRRGIAPTGLAVTLALTRDVSAAVGAELLERTKSASLRIALGQATNQVVSTSIASLVEGVITSMLIEKFKWGGVALLVSGLTLAGAVALGQGAAQPSTPPQRKASRAPLRTATDDLPADIAKKAGRQGADDRDSPTMDDRAARRSDLQKKFVAAAQQEWVTLFDEYKQNESALNRAYEASKRLMKAEAEATESSADRSQVRAHLDRLRHLSEIQHANPTGTGVHKAQIEAYVAEAELWLSEDQDADGDQRSHARTSSQTSSRSEPAPDGDPQSQRIIAKLNEPIPMKFYDETPLEDILNHIKKSTQGTGLPQGIPIYVDPIGLSEADKTLTNTVRYLDLDGVPLRRTLQLALAQLDLVYFVEDGILFITSKESADQPLPPARTLPSPFMRKLDQADRGVLNLRELKELAEEVKAYNELVKVRATLEGAKQAGGAVQ